ncbi:hypothetical protein [Flavobacterium sp. LC2016-12]|uniref:hypothetical protein n=1 Tax=Flavobacterium sp. LC2016-12 TaxID=2783794 RepID=UPI00188B6DD8|nr:hypothetical protein [Flavobacterium sp. LC2016-12]MBF4466104.1 hypothetical protein [Flavobacterium sp. LC2016-12]
MRNSSYQEILIKYGNELDSYRNEREYLLSKYKHSIILEGEFTELENLEKWAKKNLNIETLESIYFNKTDYNYCFAEYFFSTESEALKMQDVIPKIFSTYANVYSSPRIFRTNGNGESIEYKSNMLNVIIL